MITFTRAQTVSPGEPIAATHLASLAMAFNDRIRNGVADAHFRILYAALGLFRQIRNPDDTATPPQGEFFEVGYQQLDPGQASWPVEQAGDPAGINVVNPLGAYLFGWDAAKFASEADNLGAVPTWITDPKTAIQRPPQTDLEAWTLGKLQRGAVDGDTGAASAPMLVAARQYGRLIYNPVAPYNNTYGGYLPLPTLGAACAGTGPDGTTPPNYIRFFTATRADVSTAGLHGTIAGSPPTCTYSSSCPEDPTGVASVVMLTGAFQVTLNNGAVDTLPYADWVEGPYTGGGALRRDFGDQVGRVLNAFLAEFIGTPAQRASEIAGGTPWASSALPHRQFLTSQYFLAPQRGRQIDATTVAADYARATAKRSGTVFPAGPMPFADGRTTRTVRPGYVVTHACAQATGLRDAATVILYGDGKELARWTITPDATGAASAIQALGSATPSVVSVSVAFDTFCANNAGSTLWVEFTELVPYQADISDLYALARLLTSSNAPAPNGTGRASASNAAAGNRYFGQGCVYSGALAGLDTDPAAINQYAPFDAARRFSQCVRLFSGFSMPPLGYALDANGNSVLWFRRYIYTAGAQGKIDLWQGIAPDLGVTTIAPLRTYKVRASGAAIEYAGHRYAPGSSFTGQPGITTFTGPGPVDETNGIHHDAAPGGYTREWVMGWSLKPYNPADASIWKPDAYSWYFPLADRCLFYYGQIGGGPTPELPADMVDHFGYGQSIPGHGVVAPEAASAYRYAEGINQFNCGGDPDCLAETTRFHKSCKIYEPPVEVDRVEVETGNGFVVDAANPILKVTFKGRFPSHPSAAGTISNDISTWNMTTLRVTEDYRTLENGIREFLVFQSNGTNASVKTGDQARLSTISSQIDKPYGSVFPHLFFIKLAPLPYIAKATS
jgi:hypothetical protein